MPCGRADEPLREFSGVAPKPANASMRSKRDDRRQVQFVLGRGSKLLSTRQTPASSSTTPLRLPDDQATASTVKVSEANRKARCASVGRSEDRIVTRRVRRRTSRMDRSEKYMEKLLLSPEERPPKRSE
jgi:hypothetical protein